ncbi:ERG4/ERG24 ergosterol biosynthesis protein [Mycena sanguinolenta]|uniref:ERG4/ERG24 ergosterol biosynthesis protein n=1 Tax=Mycena sanguinolenta TaxID=230812 RepID=A0A8H6YAG8_9AGAR|nr:ERG4/ERG24 ergosterol biosynthesis protein [Mycena sanguinolenta]
MTDLDTSQWYFSVMSKQANPVLSRRTAYVEILGPLRAFFICTAIPLTIYALFFGCSEQFGGCPPRLDHDRSFLALTDLAWYQGLWDTQATMLFVAWYAFCVLAWAILPGDWVFGTTLRNGEKKQYKINAFSTFILALSLAFGVIFLGGPQSFTFLHDKLVGFITASVIVSVLQAVACHVMSFRPKALLSIDGNTGNPVYNFYVGRELNPSIRSFDFKSFNQLRPGLILWILIDISMVCEQATRFGGFSQVNDSLWLVLIFQALYVGDILYHEVTRSAPLWLVLTLFRFQRHIFSQVDITTDGFGFMQSVGCLSWLPFTHSLQARFLVFRPVALGFVWTTLIVLFNSLGYYIFRVANAEKNDFRNGENPKNLQFLTTGSGSKLLISGWWGRSRHPNYFGDLIMALAWSFPTGFSTPLTYFYFLYLLALLIQRQRRDDDACEKKYGKDWKKYVELVPYRIVPYVY